MGNPVCGIEHLTGLKDHLDNMLIRMGLCGNLGVAGKNKEVHGSTYSVGDSGGFKFFINFAYISKN
jgi:hypothetical protein